MTDQIFCKTCRKPKAPYVCGLCEEHVCKSCAQFLGEDYFTYLRVIPEKLKHTTYCSSCFDAEIKEDFDSYTDTMEKAKEIFIFSKEQSKQTSFLKKKEEAYHVENCEDQQEALMRMSFWAVQANYNALVDIQYQTKKIIVGSHKKSIWSGTAIPENINPNAIREVF